MAIVDVPLSDDCKVTCQRANRSRNDATHDFAKTLYAKISQSNALFRLFLILTCLDDLDLRRVRVGILLQIVALFVRLIGIFTAVRLSGLQRRKVFLRKTALFLIGEAVHRNDLLGLHFALIFEFCDNESANQNECVNYKQKDKRQHNHAEETRSLLSAEVLGVLNPVGETAHALEHLACHKVAVRIHATPCCDDV